MGYGRKLKYVNDSLFEVIRALKVHNLIVPKRNPNKIDKELLGLWVHHLGGERVLRDGDFLLIVKTVEEPEWIEI
jgi:hypothetical protein